jgi:hypothetical protein
MFKNEGGHIMSKNLIHMITSNIAYQFTSFLMLFSPVVATKFIYRAKVGKKLNLDNPRTLNEKLQWYKLYYYKNMSIVSECSDKYSVRQYIKKFGYEKYLPNLIGVWDLPEYIDLNALPQRFVLKCTTGSGGNIICYDKSKIDFKDVIKKLKKWQKLDYGSRTAELSYIGNKSKIICEELIITSDGKTPKDYKFFCEYGDPKFLFIGSDRQLDVKFDYYTIDWKWIPLSNSHPNAGDVFERPKNFNEMLDVVKKISAEFPMVRIDMYNENGKIYFGEITFLHFGGLATFNPEKYDEILGSYFKEPQLNINKFKLLSEH